jgi:hypothetical protein
MEHDTEVDVASFHNERMTLVGEGNRAVVYPSLVRLS